MSNSLAQFRTGLDKLARIIGYVTMGLVLVALAVGTGMALGDDRGTAAHASITAPAPAAAAPAPTPTAGLAVDAPASEPLRTAHLVWHNGVIYADVETAPRGFIGMLIEAGFYGDPTDGRERLYAPSVVDVEYAPMWLADALVEAGYYGDPTDGLELLFAPHSAPLTSPDGFALTERWEDGSAEYGASGFYFDPELRDFAPVR